MQRLHRDFERPVLANAAVIRTAAPLGDRSPGGPWRSSGAVPSRWVSAPLTGGQRAMHLPELVSQRQQPSFLGHFLLPPQVPPDVAPGAPQEAKHRLHHFAPVPIPLLMFRL